MFSIQGLHRSRDTVQVLLFDAAVVIVIVMIIISMTLKGPVHNDYNSNSNNDVEMPS